jgi:hypothetical protein
MIRSNKSGGIHTKTTKALRRNDKVKLTKDQRGSRNDGK